MKAFMVNQLCLSFERERIILSPFDEVLHKQLIDYSVERVSQSGLPIYTSKNEHFVDALGLAHLAFVLKFPELTQAIKLPENSTLISHSNVKLITGRGNIALNSISKSNPWESISRQVGKEPGERKGDYQKWVKVNNNAKSYKRASWGQRGSSFGGRSMW